MKPSSFFCFKGIATALTLLLLLSTLLSTQIPRVAAQSSVACSLGAALMVNGGFEEPGGITGAGTMRDEGVVPGWDTTATDNLIEFWTHNTVLNSVTYPAYQGAQFIELNATQTAALYQDVPTTPGSTLTWSLAHRGRLGTDTAEVLLGSSTGALTSQRQLSDGKSAWGVYTGTYVVPAGQTTTRFQIRSVSTATGDNSVGNFLDAITLTVTDCGTTTSLVADGVYILKAVHSKKCMETAGASMLDGGNVQQWSCTGEDNQAWQVEALGAGLYRLINVQSGKVLDVSGASSADSANIIQWAWNGNNNQKWKFVVQSDRSYQLVAVHSNKCVDVVGASSADGANIQQWSCHGGNNQRFQLLPFGLAALKGVAIVEDANLNQYIADRQAAKVLGKALFWDMSVGSDGQTACASCHFHAGADVRTKNQLSPALLHQAGAPKNSTYDPTRSGNPGGVNYKLTGGDFPFFTLADPNNRDSAITFQTDDVASSQGVYSERFVDTTPGNTSDQCALVFDSRFHLGGISTRRIEPRNTPTMINAVFNLRNFWDGRANETFNGVNPFGTRDPNAGIYKLTTSLFFFTNISKIQPNLRFSSLASQAVGPPLSDFEMSCAQRMWPNVGRRLLSRIPLQNQQVASDDSLLSAYRASTGMGLNTTYQQLIDKAFLAEYRNNSWQVALGGVNYKMSEANFSFFFGLAVQLYESTLVSDDAPLDRYLTGSDTSALTEAEKRGMGIFTGKGQCVECHSGPQLTNAGTPAIDDFKRSAIVSHMILGDGQPAIYDEGFYNIGVRPTIEDISVGALDPFGNPLSFAAQYKARLQTGKAFVDRNLTVNPCTFEINPCSAPPASVRLAVDGAFKVPTLRNVELTGPYFHNGSRSTLEQVVEFYNRGGDRRGNNSNNSSGFGSNPSNLDADIEPLGLSSAEQADLVAFLKRPLTDNRVRCDQAPFDHPQLVISNGHTGDNVAVVNDGTGRAVNQWFTIPAVGQNGMCGANLSGQRLPFVDILNAGGLVSSETGQLLEAELVLNTPLDGPIQPLLAAEEPPVETILLAESGAIVLEENVAAINTEEQPDQPVGEINRLFLPLINNQ